jgi:hypothetical protein
MDETSDGCRTESREILIREAFQARALAPEIIAGKTL